jgi:glutathione S-transferase
MYTLYYSPGACSLAVHALLHSLSIPFETVRVDMNQGGNRTPEYLKLNPRGQVPVLIEDGHIIRESAVIAVYLSDKHKSPLLPAPGWQRLEMQEWLGFYNSTLHQAYGAYFLMSKRLKDETAKEAACTLVAKRISGLWKEVEAQLEKNPYICGQTLTLVDLFHTVIANWTSVLGHKVELGPNIVRLCAAVSALPYFEKAMQAENIHYSPLPT